MQSEKVKGKSKSTLFDKYKSYHNSQSETLRKRYFNLSNHPNYIKYLSNKISLFKCDCGHNHNFKIKSDNYISRWKLNLPLCTICYPISDQKSIKEKELLGYIKQNYNGEIISGYRNQYEIDIYLPNLKIGFEFNGLYWHSELYKERDYHINKTDYFKELGIRIIHIWEDDWVYKTGIIKSQILNILGKSNRIYARKCEVKKLGNVSIIKGTPHMPPKVMCRT